jgi:hypothetical protein
MSRVTTTWYAGTTDTQFAWATTGNDLFNREQDLYRLAQALENHTHETGKGLPVGRLAALSVQTSMYAALSIPTGALQDLSVTTPKLANGAVTEAKMDVPRVLRSGDTTTGDIRLTRGGGNSGATYYGTGDSYLYWDGTNFTLNNPTANFIRMLGNLQTWRPAATTTGYLYMGTGGALFGFDGTNFFIAGAGSQNGDVHTDGNACQVPLGGTLWFRTSAELTAAGARWTRQTTADGRMVVGAGTTAGVTFNENTQYGVNWQPMTALGVVVSNATATAGGTVGPFQTAPIVFSGITTNYVPPTMTAVWGYRSS